MGGEWSTSRPGRFTPGNRRQGGPQMYRVCGVTILHCELQREGPVHLCKKGVALYWKWETHTCPGILLFAYCSVCQLELCLPSKKKAHGTHSIWFAQEPTRHFQQIRRHLSHTLYTVYYAVLFLFRAWNSCKQRSRRGVIGAKGIRAAPRLSKKFQTFCGTWLFITVFTKASHMFGSSAN
jgi:hypothetical protein